MKFFFLSAILLVFMACQSDSGAADSESENRPAPIIAPVVQPTEAPVSAVSTERRSSSDASQLEVNGPIEAGPSPEIFFEDKRFNFGEIYHADKVKHDFEFTNTGDRDLEIKGAKASCGCTTPNYPFLPIAPGEKGFIGVTFNSVGKQGPQRATIQVATNDPRHPEVVLSLSGRVLVKPLEDLEKEKN